MVGRSVNVNFDIFVPSSQPNLDGFTIVNPGQGNVLIQRDVDGFTQGTWINYNFDLLPTSKRLVFVFYSGTSTNYNSLGGNDKAYLNNVELTDNLITVQIVSRRSFQL